MNAQVKTYLNSIAAQLLAKGLVITEFSACETVDAVKQALSLHGINADGTAPTPLFNEPVQQATDLLKGIAEESNDEPEKTGIWVNVDVVIGGRPVRLTGISLDSDFNKFLDKEKTKVNNVTAALVNTVQTHGLEKANDGIEFAVTITQQGMSSVPENLDLLAGK